MRWVLLILLVVVAALVTVGFGLPILQGLMARGGFRQVAGKNSIVSRDDK